MITMNQPTQSELMHAAIDISAPRVVQIATSEKGDKVWINVDGVCVLRIQQIAADTLLIEMPGI